MWFSAQSSISKKALSESKASTIAIVKLSQHGIDRSIDFWLMIYVSHVTSSMVPSQHDLLLSRGSAAAWFMSETSSESDFMHNRFCCIPLHWRFSQNLSYRQVFGSWTRLRAAC